MTILGMVCRPSVPPEQLREVATAADTAGLDELWLWEDCFWPGAIACASAALAWTQRLSVGIGVLPVPLRNVALTAMEAAALCRLFPGRVQLGVGHGVQDWMGQVGARVASPMTLLREYVLALRELLAGETVTTSGRYVRLDAVALDAPPHATPPLHVGAIGERTLALAGELADGTVLTGGTPPEDVTRMRGIVDAARAAAGRDGRNRVTVYLVAEPGDAQATAAAVRRWADAGSDAVVLLPDADDDVVAFARYAGEQVRPLLG